MKKLLFTLMAAMVMSMSFYACDSKKANKDADAEATETETVEENEAAKDKTTESKAKADADFTLSGSPADQLVALTMQFIDVIKNTHMNSQEDAEKLKTRAESFKTKIEEVQKAMEEEMNSLSEKEQATYALKMLESVSKFESIETDIEKEMERLKKEAEAAGLNIDDLDFD